MSAPKKNKNASKPSDKIKDSILHIRINRGLKGRYSDHVYPRKISESVIELIKKELKEE